MTIKINLTEAEVRGIKDYLKEVESIKTPSKQDIEKFITSYINVINAPQEAVSNYIQKHNKNN
jgi:hypothetical protein